MSEYKAHGARMRQVICDAMVNLLEEKPFSKITIHDIMERAKIQRATFYHYFRDKYEVASSINQILANFLTERFFSWFYEQHGEQESDWNAESTLMFNAKYSRIISKMLQLRIENVNLAQTLLTNFQQTYKSRYPDCSEYEAYLASQNYLSIMSWFGSTNASIDEIKTYLSCDAQTRWMARYHSVSIPAFSTFVAQNQER